MDNIRMKISIIIPVYDVEQYIGKCLDSCLNQDLPKDEYEIVVVDDGSPDNSSRIVEGYMKKFSNIRLIHRENGGLSAARNTGLREAKGAYVWFVDSDDWIEPNILNSICNLVVEDSLDVLCFNLQLVFPDGRKNPYCIQYDDSKKVLSGGDFLSEVTMPPAAWAAIFKKDYLVENKLQFYEGILHEDQEFTPRAYCLAKRILYIDKIFYNYNQREGSIMKSKQKKRKCENLLTVADSLFNFANNKLEKGTKEYDVILGKVAFAFSQSLTYYDKDYFSINIYTQKPYYPLSVHHLTNKKEKIKYKLLNISLKLYLMIYKYIK